MLRPPATRSSIRAAPARASWHVQPAEPRSRVSNISQTGSKLALRAEILQQSGIFAMRLPPLQRSHYAAIWISRVRGPRVLSPLSLRFHIAFTSIATSPDLPLRGPLRRFHIAFTALSLRLHIRFTTLALRNLRLGASCANAGSQPGTRETSKRIDETYSLKTRRMQRGMLVAAYTLRSCRYRRVERRLLTCVTIQRELMQQPHLRQLLQRLTCR